MARGRSNPGSTKPGESDAGFADVGEPELLTPSELSFNPVYIAEPADPPAVEFSSVSKWFGSFCVLDNIDLVVDKGETLAVIGPSGAGKSTLIKCINGLERFDAGQLWVLGQTNDQSRQDLLRLRRQTGMVFQDFNLFPDYTALLNVVLPQRLVLGRPQAEAEAIAMEHLNEVGIGDQAHKRPHTMSGGQQQRVAIARTLAMEPEILLLDEITASVDPELTKGIMEIIREVATTEVTIVAVSHELGFVEATADTVGFMERGQLVEHGEAASVLQSPRHPRTRAFLNLAFDSSQQDVADDQFDIFDGEQPPANTPWFEN